MSSHSKSISLTTCNDVSVTLFILSQLNIFILNAEMQQNTIRKTDGTHSGCMFGRKQKKKKTQQKSHSADRNKPRPACRIYFRHACERKTDVVSGPATANCKQQTTTTTNIIINRIDELRKYLHIHTAHGVLVERNTRCTVHTHRHAFGNVDCCDGIYRWRV